MMDNEKLIKYVKNYKFLYDLSDKRYSDNQKKDIAWKEISHKMKVHENDCKRAWALLRDAFRRAVKKQKAKRNGKSSALYRQWKYEDEMAFLLPYFRERTSVSLAKTKEESNNYSEENLGDEISASFVEFPPEEQYLDNPSSPSSDSSSESVTPPPKKKRVEVKDTKSVKQETLTNALMAYILENKKSGDDVEQFFVGIATTVKSFPPRERAIAKAKVFEAVYKMEIEILSKPPSTAPGESSVYKKGDPLEKK